MSKRNQEPYEITSQEIKELLSKNESLSTWYIALCLGWTHGRTQSVVDRMIHKGELYFKKIPGSRGKMTKLVSLKPFTGAQSTNTNTVPISEKMNKRLDVQSDIIDNFIDITLLDIKDILAGSIDMTPITDDLARRIKVGRYALEKVLRAMHYDGVNDPKLAKILSGE